MSTTSPQTTIPLHHWRFLSFLGAQFLGAFNDNAFKLVLSMAALSLFPDPKTQAGYVALISSLAILPFLCFSGYAGYFADKYAKSTVLRISKALEITAMGAALLIFSQPHPDMHYLMITLFLLANHSTFFSPSKYGILPEIIRPEDLAKANGYLNMLTFVAIIKGSLTGAVLWGAYKDHPAMIGAILLGIAIVGTILCWFLPKTIAIAPNKHFKINPLNEILHSIPTMRQSRTLSAAMIGTAIYWLMGGLMYLALIMLGKTELGLSEAKSGSLFSFLALGIGLGSVAAGYILGKSVRRTLIVWGAVLLGSAGIACGFYATNYLNTAILMLLAGLGAGLFIVPVMTLLQQHSPADKRGQIMAASSFFDMAGVLAASGVFWVLSAKLGLSASHVIMAAGGISLLGILLAILRTPALLYEALESSIYWLARRIYKIRFTGEGLENGRFPQPDSPVVFAANHVTFIDGLLISALSDKPVRYLVLSTFWKKPFSRFVLNAIGAIPFGTGGVSETRRGFEAAREHLNKGGYLCIFPEGVLTRTGHLHPFKRGIEKLLEGMDTQIIPIHLERLWGSIFSFSGRRFFKKFPKKIPYPVTVAVGAPVPAATPAWRLNQIISELGTKAIPHRYTKRETLGARFLTKAKRHPFAPLFSDTTGQCLNHLKALIGARLLAKWLSPQLINAQNVAVLLPATVGGALVNIALSFLGKTSVNLNFSLGQESLHAALKQAEVTHIITSRTFLLKLNIPAADSMIFVEDAKKSIRLSGKLSAAFSAFLMPTFILQRLWLNRATQKTDTATILFSSGSTATPKGVCLSHENIIANIESVGVLLEQAEGRENYALTGILPFFHSFGFTVCLWLPAITGRRIAYHPNPLEAKTVAEMIAKERCAILVSTPTFARNYVQAGKEGALQSLRLVITGGEKLTPTTAEALRTALPHAHILQGYGCTELSPVVAVNMPDIQHGGLNHQGNCAGSVGKPIPSVSVQVVDVNTGELLPPTQEGLVRVKSPAQMQGYYQNEPLTHSVLQDGWYNTGDIGFMDSDGFLHITDRLSRFSKIGGEMVPHGKIEAVIEEILGEKAAVVVAVEDAQRGERLCVLLASVTYTPAQLFAALQQTDLPKLWIPRENSIFQVDAIPVLPTGKVDLRSAKQTAHIVLYGAQS
jgi:acyl-[acyl-carrier-protein]-phospholipid O-acyltransferase/long-chain-fatty-acid--[acyl-carrier-protein] ligase